MGVMSTTWKESALNTENTNALFKPGGKESFAGATRGSAASAGSASCTFSNLPSITQTQRLIASMTPKIWIRLADVNVTVNGQPVLQRISWQSREKENWAVLGPNGSGKSTFLKLVRGD